MAADALDDWIPTITAAAYMSEVYVSWYRENMCTIVCLKQDTNQMAETLSWPGLELNPGNLKRYH